MTDYDSPWKEALDEFFEPFLQLLFPEAHGDIDWSRNYESLDKELQQIVGEAESGRRYVDKLFKVWLKNGDEQWVLIHVEVQATKDVDFPERMYVYNYRAYDRYNKRDVVSFAVLGDDNPTWRPTSFKRSRWRCAAGIEFPICKLIDFIARRPELEQSENVFALFILAHLDTLETRNNYDERCDRKFGLIKRLLQRGLAPDKVRRLFRVLDWIMDLPKGHDRTFWKQVKQLQENKYMPFITTPERIGLERGRCSGLMLGIEAVLNVRFGDAGLKFLPQIAQIDDSDKLEEVLQAIKSAVTIDELPKIWTSNGK